MFVFTAASLTLPSFLVIWIFGMTWENDLHTLSKCPSGPPVLRWGLKLNSKISAGKYKKLNSLGPVDFPPGAKQKLYLKNVEIP